MTLPTQTWKTLTTTQRRALEDIKEESHEYGSPRSGGLPRRDPISKRVLVPENTLYALRGHVRYLGFVRPALVEGKFINGNYRIFITQAGREALRTL